MAQLASYSIYGLALGVIVFCLRTVRRLFLHRLRGFPGPKLAAITSLYKTYYEVFKGGELLQHLMELHVIYGMLHLFVSRSPFNSPYLGPVIRIAPNEVGAHRQSSPPHVYRLRPLAPFQPLFRLCRYLFCWVAIHERTQILPVLWRRVLDIWSDPSPRL
jgi:hypothetical protein